MNLSGALALVAVVSIANTACVGGLAPKTPPNTKRVWDISLSNNRGEAGVPFSSDVSWQDNYIKEPEIEVTGLPQGMIFDPMSRKISGTTSEPGFFPIQVAVRKRVEVGHRPEIDERWWTEHFELEIYRPITD